MSIEASTPAAVADGVRDGRDVRWEAHRTERRRQLVEAALKAIRKHGAGVGMDEIAAQAGTSKTVLYRHLGDKAGLYGAVVSAVDENVLADLHAAQERGADLLSRIEAMAHSYLSLVERDPEIYRFVMTRPLEAPEGSQSDPVHRITGVISEQITTALHTHLVDAGRAEEADLLAPAWGHGIVGMVRSAADHWLAAEVSAPDQLSVDDVTHAVMELIRPALQREDRA